MRRWWFRTLAPAGARPGAPDLCPGRQDISHADQRIGHYAQPYPSHHPFGSPIATATQAMTPFQHADATLTSRAPALRFLKPSAVFLLFPFGTFCVAIRYRHPLHALLL